MTRRGDERVVPRHDLVHGGTVPVGRSVVPLQHVYSTMWWHDCKRHRPCEVCEGYGWKAPRSFGLNRKYFPSACLETNGFVSQSKHPSPNNCGVGARRHQGAGREHGAADDTATHQLNPAIYRRTMCVVVGSRLEGVCECLSVTAGRTGQFGSFQISTLEQTGSFVNTPFHPRDTRAERAIEGCGGTN